MEPGTGNRGYLWPCSWFHVPCFMFPPEEPAMTFTALGRDPRTGRLGVSTTTGEMAIGSRAPYALAHVGAVATQALTDPRLGPLALELLKLGYPAQKVLDELTSSDPGIAYRQLGIVD